MITTAQPTGPGTSATFQLSSTKSTVTKFRYGWASPPATEIAATGTTTRAATLNLTVPRYGKNILYVSAIDTTLNEGYASVEVMVPRPSPPAARWLLETYPGVTQAQALADQQPALAGDTPLTAASVTWTPDLRLVGGRTAEFNGTSAHLTTAGPVIDTSKSFSVGAWVWLRSLDCTGNKTVLSADGTHNSAFYLGFNCEADRWRMRLADADKQAPLIESATATTPAVANRWTHIAGSWDATQRLLTLFVDGAPAATLKPSAAWLTSYGVGWAAAGPLAVGRDRLDDFNGGFFAGEIADVQVFNRVLVGHDFTGQLASDPMSGGVDEPGILKPIRVGDWDFTSAVSCYEPSPAPGTCEAPASPGSFDRRLALTQGSLVGSGHREGGLLLDGSHFTDDPNDPYFGLPTQEYGRSQGNSGDGANPVWQDGPVLRTNQSFSVSVWARPERFEPYAMTAVAHKGVAQSAFYLSARQYSVNGVSQYGWSFTVYGRDDSDPQGTSVDASMLSRPMTEDDLGTWTHLVGVYDAQARQVRLYVNGKLEDTRASSQVFQAGGPLLLGASWWSPVGGEGRMVDFWQGGLDDLTLHQGALTGAAVELLFDEQSVEGEP